MLEIMTSLYKIVIEAITSASLVLLVCVCVAENKKLSDLIQFVSGTPYLPAQLVLTFSEEIVYPVAHACFSQLDLPTRHQDYPSFRDAIIFALQHGTAFTTE